MIDPTQKVELLDGTQVVIVRRAFSDQYITANGRLISEKDIVRLVNSDIVLK